MDKSKTKIVAGWYFMGDKSGEVYEETLMYNGPSMFELSSEVAKVLVAEQLGYVYVKDIDFRYFDRSCNG